MKKMLVPLALATTILASGWYVTHPPKQMQTVTYQLEADYGDTVWSLCGKVATDEDNLMELIHETVELNNITDVGAIQPGKVITIQVKRPVG